MASKLRRFLTAQGGDGATVVRDHDSPVLTFVVTERILVHAFLAPFTHVKELRCSSRNAAIFG